MGFKNTYKQAGNVLFTLLGAVALGGVLTAGVAGVMRGPLSGAMNVHRQNMAEEQLSLTAKVATRVSVQQPSNGDCDADGYVEPLPFVDAGTNPKPAGGGYIPAAMGVAEKDPWNRKYGYCPFDHGSVINGAGCGGAGQLRRTGTNVSKWEAFAVISAGPDGVFQTSCNNWADVNTNGEPDTPLINKPQGSDDIVFTWTYEEAVAASDGLWNTETLDPTTAEVDKNISVKDGLGDEQLNFDTTSKQLTLGDGGKGSFPTVNTDSIGTKSYTGPTFSAGNYKTCIIKPDGTLWCWGQNNYGQVGDGTTTNRPNPVQVGTDTDWINTTGGPMHTCARKTNGTIWCWGFNAQGQIGDGTNTDRLTPVQVGTATDWEEIYASHANHTCARKTNGTLWCWGWNGGGQLGDGTTANRNNPVQVGTATNWQKISGGGYGHNCARRTNGTIWCWGQNNYGQVGDGTTATPRTTPVQVGSASDWIASSTGGYHSCAIKINGTLWCWGYNNYGQIGDGTTVQKTSPVQIGTATDWVKVAAGFDHTCAKKSSGTIWCWGYNLGGALGNGNTTNQSTPVQAGSASDWVDISAGQYFTCATKAGGALWCWGYNAYGQVGDGTTVQKTNPVSASGLVVKVNAESAKISIGNDVSASGKLLVNGTEIIDENGIIQHGEQDPKIGEIEDGKFCVGSTIGAESWTTINAGSHHTCLVKMNGTLWCAGDNTFGRLGDGTTTQRNSLVQIGTATNWAEVSGGDYNTCGRKTDGTLWCWGYNGNGQVGDNTVTQRTSPVQVGTGTNWAEVSLGYSHACGRKTDGTLWCWGYNGNGQLGLGDTSQRTMPVQVGTGTNWAKLTGGGSHTCGRKTDGTLWCWGYNGNGQLGLGDTTQRTSPVQVGSATNWAQITAGSSHTCGRKTDGTLWCWGNNGQYQLGDGTNIQRNSPVQIGTATNWVEVSGGGYQSCGRKTDGTIWCWGMNGNGENGDGTTTVRPSPVQTGTDSNWTAIEVGEQHSCGLKSNGTAWCWGLNSTGQFGRGDTANSLSPIDIGGIFPGTGSLECTTDPPTGITPIQNGFTDTATEGAGCTELGELRKDGSGNLLVCDDDGGTSQIDGGSCLGFEPGALTFNPSMAQFYCADSSYTPSDCTLDGQSVLHGNAGTFYSASVHPNCASVSLSRTCNDGVLDGSGTYNKSSCVAPLNCTLDGKTVLHGNSDWFYNIQVHTNCSSRRISRTCNNGVLDGSATYQYANCVAPANCTLDGVTVNHGSSRAFYSATTADNCGTVSQTRTCSNGTLSGSGTYQYANCTPNPYCTLDGVTVWNNSSYTFYTTYTHSNCASVSQSRTCNLGTLSGSGSYNKAYCSAPDPCLSGPIGTACYDGAIYIGTAPAGRIYAATSDWAYQVMYQDVFGVTGATDTSGAYNTSILLSSGYNVPAASACGGGTWNLPSTPELALIYTNRAYLTGLVTSGSGQEPYYWASTESASNVAGRQHFGTGSAGGASKMAYGNVRCIRY